MLVVRAIISTRICINCNITISAKHLLMPLSFVPSLPQELTNPIPTYEDKGKALSLLSPLLMVDVRPGVEKEGTRWGV